MKGRQGQPQDSSEQCEDGRAKRADFRFQNFAGPLIRKKIHNYYGTAMGVASFVSARNPAGPRSLTLTAFFAYNYSCPTTHCAL